MVTLQAAADAGYATLREQYAKADFSGNLWFAGNTLHTLLDHLVVSGRIDDDFLLQYAVKERLIYRFGYADFEAIRP